LFGARSGIFQDPSLDALAPELVQLQLSSKADATISKYASSWCKWRTWANSKIDVPVLPAQPVHVALYLTELFQSAMDKGIGASVLEAATYAIRWRHQMAGFQQCPTDHSVVKSCLEGAKRRLGRPVQPKEPLSLDLVVKICDKDVGSSVLSDIRFLGALSIGYGGFLRVDEIQALKVEDIAIFKDHMSITIHKRKNDQFREGHTILLARSGKTTCPVSITAKLLELLEVYSPSYPLIRRIVKSKFKEHFHASLGISSSRMREEFKSHVKPFVVNLKDFSMHSIKSGAASNPGVSKALGL
ncbi:hypothetical protein QZH41_019579, partial [Actinostola sp. cb2023]